MNKESSSGFSGESPILLNFNRLNVLKKLHKRTLKNASEKNEQVLEKIYADIFSLLQRRRSKKQLLRLKEYLQHLDKIKAYTQRDRYLIMKSRGLINYMMSKQSNFINLVEAGKIAILDVSTNEHDGNLMKSESISNLLEGDINYRTPLETIQNNNNNKNNTITEIDDIPANLLTNDNFATRSGIIPETEYMSQDMFSSEISALAHYSEQNFKILQQITANEPMSGISEDLFQTESAPINRITTQQIPKSIGLHETMEQDFPETQSMCSETPDLSLNGDLRLYNNDVNIFDKEYVVSDEAKTHYLQLADKFQVWVDDLYSQLSLTENCDVDMGEEILSVKPIINRANEETLRQLVQEFKATINDA